MRFGRRREPIQAGDGSNGAREDPSGASADLSGVPCGLKRFSVSSIEEFAAENGGVMPRTQIDDEVERPGRAAGRRLNGGRDQRGSARQRKRDGIGAGRGSRKEGQRARRVIDAQDAFLKDRKTEEEVDGESG